MKKDIQKMMDKIFDSISEFENTTGIQIKQINQIYENVGGVPVLIDRYITFFPGSGIITEQHPKPDKNV